MSEKTFDEIWDSVVEGRGEGEEAEDQAEDEVVTQDEEDHDNNDDETPSSSDDTDSDNPEEDEGVIEESSEEDVEKSEENDNVAELKATIERLTQENDYLRQGLRSNTGRVSGLQKKINRLEAELERYKNSSTSASELEDSEDGIQDLLENYPNLAKAVIALAKQQVQQEIQPISEKVESVDQLNHQAAVEKQERELDQLVPNWRDVANDQYFQAWLVAQPDEIQQMATSLDTSKVVTVFNLYAQHLGSMTQQPVQEQKQPEQRQENKPSRRQKVADVAPYKGASVSSSSAAGLDDYESIWEAVARKRAKK